MVLFCKPLAIVVVAACGILSAVVAASPPAKNGSPRNSYYLFTKTLSVDDSGVAAVPSRFKWSVETCVAGFDLQGKPIADSRVMLRLYDPHANFTAITAQMNLETVEKLQRELADIIAKKRENPNYQYRPQLYDPSLIPVGEIKGVDKHGQVIIELHPKNAK